jgi:D-psicose/D-tagatose/L-ribulose 3-epimerase
MQIALCNEVVRELGLSAQAELAAKLGYDGLEIAPFTLGDEPHRLPAVRRREIRREVEDRGLVISGLHWLLVTPKGLSITEPDPGVRGRTLDVMRGLVELCRDLGGSYLVHGSPQQRKLPAGENSRRALARVAEVFGEIAPQAEAAGVLYLIEPLARSETEVINTVAEAAATVDAVGSPALLTMVDTCAAGQAEDQPVAELIDHWLPSGRIAHIHLNDPNRKAPGQGNLRFGPILATLHQQGYTGRCAVEPFVYEPDGPSCAARAIGYLRGVQEALAPS